MNLNFRSVLKKDKEFILAANVEINELSRLDDSILSKNIDQDLFVNNICKCIVAELENETVGFVLYSYIYWANCGRGIYLSQVYVDAKYRKQGILKKLLEEIEAKEKDCHFITNLVGTENEIMSKSLDNLNFKCSNLNTYYRKIERV